MSKPFASTPFSIDNILRNELSEPHNNHYHQNRAKYKRTCEKQIAIINTSNEKTAKLSDDCDEIDKEIAKIRHELTRNRRFHFSPLALPERVHRHHGIPNSKFPYPKPMSPRELNQGILQDSGDDQNSATPQTPQLPITCSVGGITVTLENSELWRTFHKCGTEMILNRSGRRMFPYVSVRIEGMNPLTKYSVKMDIRSEDDRRYKFINSQWIPVGVADPEIVNTHKPHIDSPNIGAHWMRNEVSFAKLKITNNKETKEAKQVLLHSMHKYKPWIVIAEESNLEEDIQLKSLHFTFDVTSFVAVTAYQNENITQLKIKNNPFAKAFRDADVTAIIEGACVLTEGSPIKEMYGSETDISLRSSMLSLMPRHRMGCWMPPINMSYHSDHRVNTLQFNRILQHRANQFYVHQEYYTGHRKIPFLRHSHNSQVFDDGLQLMESRTSHHEHQRNVNYERSKRLSGDMNEWFDLSRSSEGVQRTVKSQKVGPRHEAKDQQRLEAEFGHGTNTEKAFFENTASAENQVNEAKVNDSEDSKADALLPGKPSGTLEMLRCPTFNAGIYGEKSKKK